MQTPEFNIRVFIPPFQNFPKEMLELISQWINVNWKFNEQLIPLKKKKSEKSSDPKIQLRFLCCILVAVIHTTLMVPPSDKGKHDEMAQPRSEEQPPPIKEKTSGAEFNGSQGLWAPATYTFFSCKQKIDALLMFALYKYYSAIK